MLLGDYRIEVIPDTEFRLDGGAMFGVVPRVLWERVSPPDELNRVTLTCNCLFIDTGKKTILVESIVVTIQPPGSEPGMSACRRRCDRSRQQLTAVRGSLYWRWS